MDFNINKEEYKFPLSIQTLLPDKYEDQDFSLYLSMLQKYGFSGIELNIVQPEKVKPKALKDFLAQFGLKLTMFASGALAKAHNLSLSHTDAEIRKKSIEKCLEIIDFAAEMESGVILGFIKGGVVNNKLQANEFFKESLQFIQKTALHKKVPILVEATNRYESSVANSVSEAVALIKEFDNPYLRVLPDTYHMNIEERNMLGTMVENLKYFDSLHISDNNRFFPGLGAIDFRSLIHFLSDIGYKGGLAIEGNIKFSNEKDIKISVGAIGPALAGF